MVQVKSALDQNTKLTNALQTDARMLQINLGQSKGYQVLVEGNATDYIGDQTSSLKCFEVDPVTEES